jgi:hypothetical protein
LMIVRSLAIFSAKKFANNGISSRRSFKEGTFNRLQQVYGTDLSQLFPQFPFQILLVAARMRTFTLISLSLPTCWILFSLKCSTLPVFNSCAYLIEKDGPRH